MTFLDFVIDSKHKPTRGGRMKYLSLVMVAVIVGLSWILMKTTSEGLSAEQQVRLESVLKEYLAVYLKETNPLASEIESPEIKLHVQEAGKRMEARFKFFYTVPGEDGSSNRIAREGNFGITSENGNDWVAKMEKISDTYVEFSEALQISLNDETPSSPIKDEKKDSPKKK
jgi:hypothetical protein